MQYPRACSVVPSLTDIRLTSLNPTCERFGALQTNQHVAYVLAATDPGTRIARLTRTIFCYFVVLAAGEGLIAVRMVGDVSVGAGVFANLYEALQRLLVYQQPRIGAAHFPARLQRSRQRTSTPKRKQVGLAMVGDWNQKR